MKKIKFNIGNLKNTNEGCFICKPEEIQNYDIIFENDNFIAFLDKFPPTKGYTLLATKKHYNDISELSLNEYENFQKILYKISKSIKKSFNPERILILNSGGIESHFHFHIIPMYEEVYGNFVDKIILKKEILNLDPIEREKISKKIKDNFDIG